MVAGHRHALGDLWRPLPIELGYRSHDVGGQCGRDHLLRGALGDGKSFAIADLVIIECPHSSRRIGTRRRVSAAGKAW